AEEQGAGRKERARTDGVSRLPGSVGRDVSALHRRGSACPSGGGIAAVELGVELQRLPPGIDRTPPGDERLAASQDALVGRRREAQDQLQQDQKGPEVAAGQDPRRARDKDTGPSPGIAPATAGVRVRTWTGRRRHRVWGDDYES